MSMHSSKRAAHGPRPVDRTGTVIDEIVDGGGACP
jgi:hypothetical protein